MKATISGYTTAPPRRPLETAVEELEIVLVEDFAADAELIERELLGHGLRFRLHRVESEQALRERLAEAEPDLVLADNELPTFSGIEALQIVRPTLPDVPFIFVSGTIGEERAIELVRAGATDYVLKGRISRLGPAVERALREVDERRARRRLEESVSQIQKLEAVGRLAGGVAHDFNNVLTAILGYSDILRVSLGPEHPQQESVAEIQRAARRAAGLTRQLLAFGRRQHVSPSSLNLNSVIQGIERMFRPLFGATIDIRLDLEPDLPPVYADPVQMEQVLMNLALNSRDAVAERGEIVVATRSVAIEPGDLPDQLRIRPGPYVEVRFTDDGCGIPPESLGSVFEPFFTTKTPEKGTGLGLATVYGIVAQAQGHISVESEPGQATTFTILLPIASSDPETSEETVARPDADGVHRVLLVEDQDAVRQLVAQTLRAKSYRVIEVGDAEEALRLLEDEPAHRPRVDALITDVMLPRMSGPKLVETMRSAFPDLKVLFISGFVDRPLADEVAVEPIGGWLQKPFSPDELLAKLRELGL